MNVNLYDMNRNSYNDNIFNSQANTIFVKMSWVIY